MAKRGLRKLVDVWGSMEAGAPVHDALQSHLKKHRINYQIHSYTDHYDGNKYWRYFVQVGNLQVARKVLPELRVLQAEHIGASA